MEIHHEVNSLKLTLKNRSFSKERTALHWHEKLEIVLEIVLALDKPFELLIEGERYEIEVGDVVIIGERIIHLYDIKEDDTKVRIGQFSLNSLVASGITPLPIQPVIKKAELDGDPELSFKVRGILDAISRETVIAGQDSPFLQLMLSALYVLLMSRFATDGTDTNKKDKREFYKVIEFVNEHYREPITVSDIAKRLYMDRGRLSKLFLKYSCTPLTAYLTSLRLARAEELIASGRSVTDAALEAGFSSVRTFNEVYKKNTGKTPSKLKRNKA